MGQVVAIMNQKGGVAKTTTAINLAGGFTFANFKVLTVDIDAQASFSKFAKTQLTNCPTIVDVLSGNCTVEDAIQHTTYGDVLLSSPELDAHQILLGTKPSAPLTLRKLLEPIKDNYDYILLDCPGARNIMTTAALVAADNVIIPTDAEYLSIDVSILCASDLIPDVIESFNPYLKIAGFLVVRFNENTRENKNMLALLDEVARSLFNSKVFNTKIRRTIAIPESHSSGQTVFEYSPNCTASVDYLHLIKELLAA